MKKTNKTKTYNDQILDLLKKSKNFRQKLAYSNHFWFFRIYLSHYLTYPAAWFHDEMFALTEDEKIKLSVVMAFRNSGKSTIMNLSYALWAILGKQQKKFILIISRNKQQAKTHFENLKIELENNELLINDFGSFRLENGEFGSSIIEVKKLGAKIMAISSSRSVRGMRHGIHRPDLVICDDIEDTDSSRSDKEQGQTYERFINEILPCGDNNTKFIVLGNLLSEKSLLMRLKENIEKGLMTGTFRAYPLLDDDGKTLWAGKFTNPDTIINLRQTMPTRSAWNREYLLIISRDGIPFTRETIRSLDDFRLAEKIYKEEKEKIPINNFGYRISAPKVEPNRRSIFEFPDCAEIILKQLNETGKPW